MDLVSLGEAQVLEAARQSWAAEPDSASAVAEALRAELWARQVSTRRSLCQRVVERMQAVRQIDFDRITHTLTELEQAGDVTAGDYGRLAAAPLRAVDLGASRYRLFGGPATARLRQLLDEPEMVGAVSRQVTVMEADNAEFRRRVVACGGVILIPEQWSGLDRTPPADAAWLDGLDEELAYHPGAASALQEGYGDWRCYVADGGEAQQRLRWKRTAVGATGRLWRARYERGYNVHVWTAGNHPLQGGHLRLSRDQAARTAFALDRIAGCPIVMQGESGEPSIKLSVDAFLPTVEYRYLLTLGDRIEASGPPRYQVPKQLWPQVAAILETRLGVVVNVQGG